MANADMTRLIDHSRMRLPGALDVAIQFELFAVMNEFFQSSNIWTENIAFDVTPTSSSYVENPEAYTYELTPTDGAITRLMGVVDANGYPVRAYMPVLGQLVLEHSPNTAQTYVAKVALTVTDPVTREGYPVFPDWVLNKYGNDILDGVLGRMMSQTAKPYSNPSIALAHLKSFKNACARAKVEATQQNVYRGQNWRFPQTFARRRYWKL